MQYYKNNRKVSRLYREFIHFTKQIDHVLVHDIRFFVVSRQETMLVKGDYTNIHEQCIAYTNIIETKHVKSIEVVEDCSLMTH